MSDFLLRLVETARGAATGLRADVPATVLDSPLEIDEEVEAPPLAPRAEPASVSVARPTVAPPQTPPRPPQHAAPKTRPLTPRAELSPTPPSRPARREPGAPSVPAAAPTRQPTPTIPPTAVEERSVLIPVEPEPPPLVAAVARRPETLPSLRRAAPAPAQPTVDERIVRTPGGAPPPSFHLAASQPPPAPAEEVVRISIGRIEVRTVAPPAPRVSPVQLARPRHSLDDHLAERDRGRR